jgi:hypothetical protein
MKGKVIQEVPLFDQFRDSIMGVDPVYFCEKNLMVDGEPLSLSTKGFKPFADIYRYIGLKAINPDAKPIVLVKGRQVGATTMAAALTCYFAACGIFGKNGRPPMRLIHLFPTLTLAAAYTKDKLDSIISQSNPVPGTLKNNGLPKSFMETKFDASSPANNNMSFKRFIHGNQVWIDSTGMDGDRIRGRTVDGAMFDECFPYDQEILTENGYIKIGNLFNSFVNKNELKEEIPLVKTYNIESDTFEFKKIKNAWNRGNRSLVKLILASGFEIKCTPNHKFLTIENEWVEAKDLKNRTIKCLSTFSYMKPERKRKNKSDDITQQKVSTVEKTESEDVYDIEVEDNHNFIIYYGAYGGGLIAHNCQDIPDLAMGAVEKILARARYGSIGKGVQVFFGTPKRKGGAYWNMWQDSSQNYFHLRCEKCGKYFPLYRPDINWEDIWLHDYTVRCPECGCEQDKIEAQDRGKWISLNPNPNAKFVGYHINQLYIPKFKKETIISAKPENNPLNTERLYKNEVLGEFHDGEGGTISIQEIYDRCIDKDRRMVKSISPNSNKRVYAGFDWGQRSALEQVAGRGRGQSYSCVVILTVEGSLFNVEFATKLNRNEPEYKMQSVEEMFRRYGLHLAVGDIGDANDLTHNLQKIYDEKFLASRASHKVMGHIKYSNEEWPKTIIFEKDYYISEIIGLLKEGRIKFPLHKSYERISWLLEHCASMDIKVTTDKSGEPIRKFVKGSTPNDGLMALLNAYLAWKFDVTQGFNISNPNHMKLDLAKKGSEVQAVLGYVPGMR